MKPSSFKKLILPVAAIALGTFFLMKIPLGEQFFSSISGSERRAIKALEEMTSIGYKQDETGHVVKLSATAETMNDQAALLLRDLPWLRVLHFERSGISDQAMNSICQLPQLESLFLDDTGVTDIGIASLKKTSTLKMISVAGCKLTNDSMEILGQLQELTFLNLANTEIDDEGIRKLKALQHIESLYLNGTSVTGEGLQSLGNQTSLTLLDLSETTVDFSIVDALPQFPNLELFYLAKASLNDEVLARLLETLVDNNQKLRSLSLQETALTDAAITPLKLLAKFPDLAVVQLQDTRITKAAFLELARVVPDVNFSVDYPAAGK